MTPPSVPKSVIDVPFHRTACPDPSPGRVLEPVTCPESLMPLAQLFEPPSVPKSIIVFPFHRNAWLDPSPAGLL